MLSSVEILKQASSKLARSVMLSLHRKQVTLPPLPYGYDALEPYISREIMELHYDKHHRAYVANLNMTLIELDKAKAKNDTGAIIALEPRLRFNGGGHLNHSIFWQNLAPVSKDGGQPPKGSLAIAIDKTFGSFDNFQKLMTAAAIGLQGSGWAWLAMCLQSGRLAIVTTNNQDPVVAAHGLYPLLGIDVWEHAYYLQYHNVRPDYLKAIWNIINWIDVQQRFDTANSN